MEKVIVTYQIPKAGLNTLYNDFEVIYPEKEQFSYDEVMGIIPECDAIISINLPVDKKLMDAASRLKIISNHGAGTDNVDIPYATEKGIAVTNTPDVVTEATAELAVGLMLSVMRRITECDRKLRLDKDYKWGIMHNLGTLIYGKAVGIIGMGKIGRAVARRCSALGMKILYHNRNRLSPDMEGSLGASYLPMEELLSVSDVVSLNMPLKKDTYHLIGEKELKLMKPAAYLVNAARGSVVDEKALVKCLKEGIIAGAGLDVFEKEPGISPELFEMDNVVLTPHIGTQTLDSRIAMAQDASNNIIDFFKGVNPKYLLNPEYRDNIK